MVTCNEPDTVARELNGVQSREYSLAQIYPGGSAISGFQYNARLKGGIRSNGIAGVGVGKTNG